MIIMLKQVQKLTILLGLWISLPVFLLMTNPEDIPLLLLFVPFILLAMGLYKTAETVLSRGNAQLSRKRVRFLAGVIAVLPTLLLVLASIQQLTVRDGAIVVGLLMLLTFYMKRIDFNAL